MVDLEPNVIDDVKASKYASISNCELSLEEKDHIIQSVKILLMK